MRTALFLATVSLFGGCSQKVHIRALVPAEVDRMASTKKIAVARFENDRVGLSNKIEALLAKQTIDGKRYFTITDRSDLEKVLAEQKLQNSGLLDADDAVEIGNIVGAQAIVSGRVSRPSLQDTRFYEKRVSCADKECKKVYTYRIRCVKRTISLSADLKVIDVRAGDIIYADTIGEKSTNSHCNDDSKSLLSLESGAQKLAESIARRFTYKLMPHYKYFDVVLLDDPDLDYTDKQERLLENALEYIEQKRLDKAEKLLIRLINSTAQKSYVPLYNLGVIKEAQGKYAEAREYYMMADDLTTEPIEEINEAVVRIKEVIQNDKKTKEQLRR